MCNTFALEENVVRSGSRWCGTGGVREVGGERGDVERGGHCDHPQVGPPPLQALHHAKQNICPRRSTAVSGAGVPGGHRKQQRGLPVCSVRSWASSRMIMPYCRRRPVSGQAPGQRAAGAHLGEVRVDHGLAQEHAVGEVLDDRPAGALVVEAHRIAHLRPQSARAANTEARTANLLAQPNAHFLGHALRDGDGRHSARLSDGYPLVACESSFYDVLWDL